MEKVSVILPTYNCAKYVGAAVESVLKQTYTNYELIIINDGSTDDTDEVLAQYISNNTILYIKQENKGHAGARNTGMTAATGTFIAFIDSDDIWLPEKLEEQIRACENDTEIGLVHCNVYGFGENHDAQVRNSLLTKEQIDEYSGYIFDNLYTRKIIITTTTVLIRKQCIDDVGMFDENLTRYGSEDRDLFLRILWKYKAKYVNKPLAMYRNRSDSEGQNYEKMIKGQKYVYDKISSLYNLSGKTKREVMSRLYQEWAREFYSKGCLISGIANQFKAIWENPVDINAYLAFKRYFRYLVNSNN
jgi:glycosyltransferase involved in cell wall biosynthesis